MCSSSSHSSPPIRSESHLNFILNIDVDSQADNIKLERISGIFKKTFANSQFSKLEKPPSQEMKGESLYDHLILEFISRNDPTINSWATLRNILNKRVVEGDLTQLSSYERLLCFSGPKDFSRDLPKVADLLSESTRKEVQECLIENVRAEALSCDAKLIEVVDKKIALFQTLSALSKNPERIAELSDLIEAYTHFSEYLRENRDSLSSVVPSSTVQNLPSIEESNGHLEDSEDSVEDLDALLQLETNYFTIQTFVQNKVTELTLQENAIVSPLSDDSQNVVRKKISYVIQVPIQFKGAEDANQQIEAITRKFPSLESPVNRSIQFVFGFNLRNDASEAKKLEMAQFCEGSDIPNVRTAQFLWEPLKNPEEGQRNVNFSFIRNEIMSQSQDLIRDALADPQKDLKVMTIDPDTAIDEGILIKAERFWEKNPTLVTAAHYEFKSTNPEDTLEQIFADVTSELDPLVKKTVAEKQFLGYQKLSLRKTPLTRELIHSNREILLQILSGIQIRTNRYSQVRSQNARAEELEFDTFIKDSKIQATKRITALIALYDQADKDWIEAENTLKGVEKIERMELLAGDIIAKEDEWSTLIGSMTLPVQGSEILYPSEAFLIFSVENERLGNRLQDHFWGADWQRSEGEEALTNFTKSPTDSSSSSIRFLPQPFFTTEMPSRLLDRIHRLSIQAMRNPNRASEQYEIGLTTNKSQSVFAQFYQSQRESHIQKTQPLTMRSKQLLMSHFVGFVDPLVQRAKSFSKHALKEKIDNYLRSPRSQNSSRSQTPQSDSLRGSASATPPPFASPSQPKMGDPLFIPPLDIPQYFDESLVSPRHLNLRSPGIESPGNASPSFASALMNSGRRSSFGNSSGSSASSISSQLLPSPSHLVSASNMGERRVNRSHSMQDLRGMLPTPKHKPGDASPRMRPNTPGNTSGPSSNKGGFQDGSSLPAANGWAHQRSNSSSSPMHSPRSSANDRSRNQTGSGVQGGKSMPPASSWQTLRASSAASSIQSPPSGNQRGGGSQDAKGLTSSSRWENQRSISSSSPQLTPRQSMNDQNRPRTPGSGSNTPTTPRWQSQRSDGYQSPLPNSRPFGNDRRSFRANSSEQDFEERKLDSECRVFSVQSSQDARFLPPAGILDAFRGLDRVVAPLSGARVSEKQS